MLVRRCNFALWFVTSAALFMGSPAAYAQEQESNDRGLAFSAADILPAFSEIILRDIGGSDRPRLKKWRRTPRVAILGTRNDELINIAANAVEDLSRVTGLQMEFDVAEEDANLFLFFASDPEQFARSHMQTIDAFYANLNQVSNVVRRFQNGAGTSCVPRILSIGEEFIRFLGLILIGNDPSILRHCIHNILTISLGAQGVYSGPLPSIRSDRIAQESLQDIDRDVLQLLYLPALAPGIDSEDAFESLSALIAERRPPSDLLNSSGALVTLRSLRHVIDPATANRHFAKGISFFQNRQYFNAALEFTAALDAGFEDVAELMFRRGIANDFAGNKALSIEDYSQALVLGSARVGELYYRRGANKQTFGRHAEAIEDFDLALENGSSGRAEILFRRANSHRALGHLTAAVDDYTAALREGVRNRDEAERRRDDVNRLLRE